MDPKQAQLPSLFTTSIKNQSTVFSYPLVRFSNYQSYWLILKLINTFICIVIFAYDFVNLGLIVAVKHHNPMILVALILLR